MNWIGIDFIFGLGSSILGLTRGQLLDAAALGYWLNHIFFRICINILNIDIPLVYLRQDFEDTIGTARQRFRYHFTFVLSLISTGSRCWPRKERLSDYEWRFCGFSFQDTLHRCRHGGLGITARQCPAMGASDDLTLPGKSSKKNRLLIIAVTDSRRYKRKDHI